jgi:hypothetical protein
MYSLQPRPPSCGGQGVAPIGFDLGIFCDDLPIIFSGQPRGGRSIAATNNSFCINIPAIRRFLTVFAYSLPELYVEFRKNDKELLA